MDLTLVTGLPGSGKTLNTIKDVEQRRLDENRQVYYYNIEGLKLDWIEMQPIEALADNPEAITPHSWFNAPKGAIIVIDECQFFYPASLRTNPDYISKLSMYRHEGYSIYLITQSPKSISMFIRDLAQPHIHYRRLWGRDTVLKYVNESCVDNTRSKQIAVNAMISRVRLDKAMFDKYTSSVQHNKNKRINKKLLAFIILPIFVLPLSLYFAVTSFANFDKDKENKTETTQSASSTLQSASQSITPQMPAQTSFDPVTAYKPRIDGMPETSPAYDNLRQAVDFPRAQCVYNHKTRHCSCYTQQATLMIGYPPKVCIYNAKYGYFDPTRAPKNTNPQPTNKPLDKSVSY